MNIIYLCQFRDASGYGVAGRGYLAALDDYLLASKEKINLRVLNVSFEEPKVLSKQEEDLIQKYEFATLEDANRFADTEDFILVWHQPAATFPWGLQTFGKTDPVWQTAFHFMMRSRQNVNLTVWEASKVPHAWNKIYKAYNTSAVIVPSTWNKEVFSKSVSLPTYCVPHVLDFDKQDFDISPLGIGDALKDKFVILSVSQFNNRKGFDKLLKAYYMEFGRQKDTVLILKTYGSVMKGAGSQTDQAQLIAREINSYKNAVIMDDGGSSSAQVFLISDVLPRNQLNWLYQEADLFALSTRGEGFGLTIADALMRAVPVCVPDHGGYMDFTSEVCAFLTEGSMEPYESRPEYNCNMNWHEPSINSIRKALRTAYKYWVHPKPEVAATLLGMGAKGQAKIKKLGWTSYNIGERLVTTLKDIQANRPVLSKVKQTTHDLKRKIILAPTMETKIAALKGAYAGETAYLLACGPSLNDYDADYLRDVLKDKFVATIKQAYFKAPDLVDFHFFNCSNLPQGEIPYPYEDNVISVASSNYGWGQRWSKDQPVDLFFKIPTRVETSKVMTVDRNFDDYTFDKGIVRNYIGPGINYETVFPMLEWLGFSKIVTIGYDLAPVAEAILNKNALSAAIKDYPHSYDEPVMNGGDMMVGEIAAHIDSSRDFYNHLISRGIEFTIASERSHLWSGIPRIKI